MKNKTNWSLISIIFGFIFFILSCLFTLYLTPKENRNMLLDINKQSIINTIIVAIWIIIGYLALIFRIRYQIDKEYSKKHEADIKLLAKYIAYRIEKSNNIAIDEKTGHPIFDNNGNDILLYKKDLLTVFNSKEIKRLDQLKAIDTKWTIK